MSLTNRRFVRYVTQIARRSSSWAFDTMTMGDDLWDKPNNSVERFCKEIEDIIGWLRAEDALQKSKQEKKS